MFVLLVRYKCKQGCRDRYYEAIKENHIDEMSRAEEGCIRYEYSFGVAEDELLLTEVWRDAEAIEVHKNSVHFFHNYTERRGYGKNVDKGIRLC